MPPKPDGFFYEDPSEDEEIERELEFSNLMNERSDEDEEQEDGFDADFQNEDFSYDELKRRYDLVQMLVYTKDKIINSQLNHIDRLEKENKSFQDQYQMLYSAFTGLSEKAKDMLKREKVLKLFLKEKDFGIEDIDEFITDIRVRAHYKNKNK